MFLVRTSAFFSNYDIMKLYKRKGNRSMKKLKKTIVSLLLTLVMVSGITPVSNLTGTQLITVQAAVSKKQTAKFVRGVDGDTAKLSVAGKTYTFRFLAIDTPETVKPGTPVAFMGKRASNYTKSELKKAKKIQIQYEKGNQTDKYGRKLAWIFVDGQLLQDKLVKKGYARVYYVYGNYKYTAKLRASEKVAKRKKLGVWKNYKAAFPDSKNSSNKSTTKKKTTKKVSTKKKNTKKSNTASSSYVWIPRTGSKYHSRSLCSNMKNPSKVKKSDAISRGYTPCSKCY